MKIAQISTCWVKTPPEAYGGTEIVVSNLTEQLVAQGHEVTLYATGDSVTRANLWYWLKTPPTKRFQQVDEILHVVKAYEHILEQNFDFIHNHTYNVGPALLSLCAVPSATTFHGGFYKPGMYFFEAFVGKHQYISISQRQQQLMPELSWIGNVYHGIDASSFPFTVQKDDYLLFIGNIVPWKGPHLAVQVALELGCRLKIAGPLPKDMQDYYERDIAPFIDGRQIEYIGEVNFRQKTDLYSRAFAVLVPISWEEPFGLVMVEALACGTPVIAFRKGATPEIIVHGQVGFLVDTISDMIAAVGQLKQISSYACREHIEQHFNIELMAKRYVEIYSRLIERRQR